MRVEFRVMFSLLVAGWFVINQIFKCWHQTHRKHHSSIVVPWFEAHRNLRLPSEYLKVRIQSQINIVRHFGVTLTPSDHFLALLTLFAPLGTFLTALSNLCCTTRSCVKIQLRPWCLPPSLTGSKDIDERLRWCYLPQTIFNSVLEILISGGLSSQHQLRYVRLEALHKCPNAMTDGLPVWCIIIKLPRCRRVAGRWEPTMAKRRLHKVIKNISISS